jgi:hypothetical protein
VQAADLSEECSVKQKNRRSLVQLYAGLMRVRRSPFFVDIALYKVDIALYKDDRLSTV